MYRILLVPIDTIRTAAATYVTVAVHFMRDAIQISKISRNYLF